MLVSSGAERKCSFYVLVWFGSAGLYNNWQNQWYMLWMGVPGQWQTEICF